MTDTAAPPPPAPEPVRRSSAGRLIRRLLLAVVVLIILAVVILFLSLNSLVRAGIVRGGHDATGQNTDLTSANLSLVGGTLQLAELGIHNPEGYTAPTLLTMKSCDVTVQSSSIFSHTVVIDSIAIDGLNINLEQNGMKNNLSEIIDTIQKKTSAADTTGTSNAPPGKELKITRLSLTGTKVHIRSGAPLNLNMDLDLPPLSIDDPTNPDGRPMKIADLREGCHQGPAGCRQKPRRHVQQQQAAGAKQVSRLRHDVSRPHAIPPLHAAFFLPRPHWMPP
jgi:hypothetical protein